MEEVINMEKKSIVVAGSPHVRGRMSTRGVMWNVVIALMPALIWACYVFGWRAGAVVAVSIAASMSTEYLINRFMFKRRCTLGDGTALLTGLLLGMSLPSSLPLGMAAIGGVFAIGVGKMAFGGLGQNIFNPALVGRVFLLISFPAAMTTWPVPLDYDGATGATILSAIAEDGLGAAQIDLADMLIGNRGGSLGEIGAITLLIGGIYLLCRRIIKIWIPAAILLTVAALSLVTGNALSVELLSGGMILGAIFMATDYVTSPVTRGGMILYGVLIGVITFVIRHYGSYPEGISFAILIMNGCTPLINRYMKPKRFGGGSKQ